MWAKKSKSQIADIVLNVYALLLLSIEYFVYDMSHWNAVKESVLDLILG